MGIARRYVALAAALVGFAMASTAMAQDYTVTNVTNRWVDPPASATTLGCSSIDDGTSLVSLPFDFIYFGTSFDQIGVCSNGFAQMPTTTTTTWSNPVINGSTVRGLVAPLWEDINPAPSASYKIQAWTSGTAPNRVWYCAWVGIPHYYEASTGASSFHFQMQLHESGGRIVFAYNTASGTWTSGSYLSYSVGITAPSGDTRYITPSTHTGNNNTSPPPNDWQFDPDVTNFSGTLTYDKLAADTSGYGNTVMSGLPATGARVELVNGSGSVVGVGTCDESGDFIVQGLALPSSGSGTLRASSETAAASVLTSSQGQPHKFTLASGLTFGTDAGIGTKNLDSGTDTDATFRQPLNVALTLDAIRTFVLDNADMQAIPRLNVTFQPNSNVASKFSPSSDPQNPSTLRVGTAASGNNDAWDEHVLTRLFAHHVLESLTSTSSAARDHTYDAATNAENAFAEAFGYFLVGWMHGTTEAVDALSTGTARTVDLETVNASTPRGPTATPWVAGALFDILDAANESHDRQDGGGDGSEVLDVIARLSAFPTAERFYDAWGDQLLDGTDLSRNYIFHGLLGDDSYEENDERASTKYLGSLGRRIPGLILNKYNDDFFSVEVSETFPGINADVVFNRSTHDTDLVLELLDAGGAVIATGAADGPGGPFRVSSPGAVPLGRYTVRIAHASGMRLSDYALQIYADLEFGAALSDWTVDRPYDQSVAVRGGIQPFVLKLAKLGNEDPLPPPGLFLNTGQLKMSGTPTEMGTYQFVLQASDSADPPTSIFSSQEITINPTLRLAADSFTPFALGQTVDHYFVATGGTPPLTVQPAQGNLPMGLDLSDTELRITGTAGATGGGSVRMEAEDVAGSNDTVSTTVVVCGPGAGRNVEANLLEGDAAAGWYFDALKDSSILINVKTVRKQPKRLLDGRLIGPDGLSVPGAIVIGKNGKAKLAKLIAPLSGRYFLVLNSQTGAETRLSGNGKLVLPRKTRGSTEEIAPDFGSGDPSFLVRFGALEGAEFTLLGKSSAGSGLQVQLQAAIAPDGAIVHKSQFDYAWKGRKFTVEGTATQSGTWTLLISPQQGPRGTFSYVLKIKQPKGGTYEAE